MTTTVIRPNASSGTATIIGGAASFHAALSDDNVATYIQPTVGVLDVTLDFGTYTLLTGEITKSVTSRINHSGPVVIAVLVSGATALTWTTSSASATESSAVIPFTGTQSDVNGLRTRLTTGLTSNASFEKYLDLVTVPLPVVAVTAVSPDPYTASTSVPIAWANTLDSDGGAQTHYQMRVFTDAQYLAGGFDPATSTAFYETGQVASAVLTATTGPLPNTDTYRAYVRVAQTVNGVKHWAAYAFDTFSMNVVTSDISTVTSADTAASGMITVTANRDASTPAWAKIEVERSLDAGTTWAAVRNATLADSTGHATVFTVIDYEVPNGQAVIYRARSTYYSGGLSLTGAFVESASDSWTSTDDWIKSPLDSTLNIVLRPSDYAPTTRTTRSGSFSVIGAAAPVIVSDTLTNPAGGTITYRTVTSAEALSLDAILEGSAGVLLLNLRTDSLLGTLRNGFMYAAILGVTEVWGDQFYRGGSDRRFFTIAFTTVGAPADATAGTL